MNATEPDAAVFDELMAEVRAATERFDHRAHLHLAWLAIRRVGMPGAVALISAGIQRTARNAGAPQKYDAALTRSWVELVAQRAAGADFEALLAEHPELLDKDLPERS